MRQKPSRLVTFQTDDPDYFADHITSVAPSVTIQKRGRYRFRAQSQLTRLPRLGLFKVTLSNARVYVPESLSYDSIGSITVPLQNAFETVRRGQTHSFTPGSAYVAHWDEPFDLRTGARRDMLVANVDQPFLHDFICKLSGGNAPDTYRWGPQLSLATPGGASFWRYLNFVWHECTRGSAILWSPLVLKELEDALVATLLYALEEHQGETYR